MRKVVATELVSVDGVMEKPEEWAFSYSNNEMEEANASGMANSDAMLLGRVTYEEFASYWPYQNSAEQPYTDYLNNTPKFVVSMALVDQIFGFPSSWGLGYSIGKTSLTRTRSSTCSGWGVSAEATRTQAPLPILRSH